MKVTFVSPSELHEYNALWLNVTTDDGNRTILNGHEPLIANLKPQSTVHLELQDTSKITHAIKSGIIAIDRTTITIVLGS